MKCESCKIEMQPCRSTNDAPYWYTISGLPNLGLVGINYFYCERCEDKRPLVPRIAELHRVVAVFLIQRPTPLGGAELRFVRKQAGFPQKEFAALLDITPEHVCRVEREAGKYLSDRAEKHARAIVACVIIGGDAARDFLLKTGRALGASTTPEAPPIFKLSRTGWKEQNRAA